MDESKERSKDTPTLMDVLTPRQFIVTVLVASGLKNREIAKTINVTVHVVRNHLRAIFDRAGCWNRTELALRYVYELEMGLYDHGKFMERLVKLRKSSEQSVVKISRKRSA